MSILHFDKSVLTLHLREVLEDHHRGGATPLLGLGAVAPSPTPSPQSLSAKSAVYPRL